MNARGRRVVFVSVLVLFFVLSVFRLVRSVQQDGVEDASFWIALLIVALICVVLLAVVVSRARSAAAHVQRLRPQADVIPAFSTAETIDEARAQGAEHRGWLPMGGTPMALAVLSDRVEVWARGEDEPRWSVARVPGGAWSDKAVYGSRQVAALRIADGVSQVTVMPAYRPLRATGGLVGGDVELAISQVTPR